MTKFSVISAGELGTEERASWQNLQQQNPLLASPYFCPEFTLAVAGVRDDVRICVMEDGRRITGFFPFQRGRFGAGRPVGGKLSDYQGAIAEPDASWDVERLLSACRLGFWQFDHLVVGQLPFEKYAHSRSISPIVDVSAGFDEYRAGRRRAGSSRIGQLERKAHKLAREVGPLRFEAHSNDPQVLAQVFTGKSEQCRRTGVIDYFALPWTRSLVERVLDIQLPHFAGMLSALYAGDQLVAAHLGMRSTRVWHWWFPVYVTAFARYSPGGILLLKLAEQAAALGLDYVDLGKGDDAYKAAFHNRAIMLAEGRAARRSVGTALHDLGTSLERRLRASALIEPVRPALRGVKQWMRQKSYA
jgi:CelD/BcsL family acetyltransferase involved in cellulose biosynthesis